MTGCGAPLNARTHGAARWWLAVPLLTLPLAGACHFSAVVGGPNYEKLEADIHDKLSTEYAEAGHTPSAVDCPRLKPAPRAGDTFICTTTVDGQDNLKVRIEVTVGDNDTVDYHTLDTVYDLQKVGHRLSQAISKDQGFPVTVDCGEGVKVVAVGKSFNCVAANRAGKTRTVRLTVGGVEAQDRWELLP